MAITGMALSPPALLLALTGLVVVLGVVHEVVAVRKFGLSYYGKEVGLITVAVIYVILCVSFVILSELASVEYAPQLSAYLPDVVEASLWGDLGATCVCFAFSLVLSNTSVYDAYWSVLPPVIALYWWVKSDDFSLADGMEWNANDRNRRRSLELAVYIIWAVRLTYNWARGWSGLHHVDWRYVVGPGSPQPFSPSQ